MKTYLTIIFNSEGGSPSEVQNQLLNLGFKVTKEINYPAYKKENTEIMFKRIIGRAIPSKWEYHTLMGVFSKTLEKIKNKKN